uniref:Smad nuclear-interacting protein 1 n=1 Tax=Schistosoma japonicum TaxID=6182 RepID=C1LKT6_SCHJA|nr:Smad nuclear-interacting protein 1 [Schistosoma japonicum]
MGVSSSDNDIRRQKKSKSKHKHKHKMKDNVKIKDEEFTRPKKPSRQYSDSRSHHSSYIKVKREPEESYNPPHKRRLNDPVILKPEFSRRGNRVCSPVVLNDNEEISEVKPDFGRSGLLDKQPGPVARQKANFELSGKLAEDTNVFKGVVIKYNEPEDARKPTTHWRLYAFKGNKTLSILHIHRQSGFLIGRDRKVADIPMDHPSISKQHAVLQYRLVRGLIRLYIIDLESANGTYLNNNRIESRRYYELLEKDVIKFGFSTREYVFMTSETDIDDSP